MDRTRTSFYRLSVVTVFIYSVLAAILNAQFLPASVTYVRRIMLSYPSVYCNIQYSSVIVACVGLQSLLINAFLLQLEVGHRASDIGRMVIGWPTLAAAGLIV